MTPRQKWGLSAIITAILLAVVGAVVFFTTVTPAWVGAALSIAGAVLPIVGLTLLFVPTPPDQLAQLKRKAGL